MGVAGESISESYKKKRRRTYSRCGLAVPQCQLTWKRTHTHTVAMTIQESGWLLVHLFEVPLHSCGKYTRTLELSKVYCLGPETGQTEPTLGAIWNMFICAFTNPSLGHLLLSVLDAESCIHRLRNSVLWRMMQEFWGQPRLHSDNPYEKAKTKPNPPKKTNKPQK